VIQVWKVPNEGLKAVERTPISTLKGHYRRVISVDFHPISSNVLVSSAGDWTMKLWDVETSKEKLKYDDHPDQVMSVIWNWDGSIMATSCKDKKLRLIDARASKLSSVRDGFMWFTF
jgi:coronin-1B/1C/6